MDAEPVSGPAAGSHQGRRSVHRDRQRSRAKGLSITSGIISRFDKVKEQTLIRTSTPVSPGNSGGPLILCRGGSLGGIVTLQSRITNVQNVNFATPAQYLLDKENWEFESDQKKAQQLLDKAIAQAPKK